MLLQDSQETVLSDLTDDENDSRPSTPRPASSTTPRLSSATSPRPTATRIMDSPTTPRTAKRAKVTNDTPTKMQPTMHRYMHRKPNSDEIENFKYSLAYWLAVDMHAISTAQKPGFRHFISNVLGPDFDIPSDKTIKTYMSKIKNELKQDIEEKISAVEDVAISTDCWQSRTGDPYITTTAHYIDREWEIHSATIFTASMPESHDADNLQEKLEVNAAEWELGNKKIVATTHDNAGNIQNAVDQSDVLGESNRCFAHTQNLAVMEALNTPRASNLISKCIAIVGHFKHSHPATEELHKMQKHLNLPEHDLIQCMKIRWNSYYYMFDRLILQKEAIIQMTLKKRFGQRRETASHLDLSDEEWTDIIVLRDILKPIAKLLTHLCGESYVTLSAVRPTVFAALKQLEPKETDTDLLAQTKRILWYRTAIRFDIVPSWMRDASGNEKRVGEYLQSPLTPEDPHLRLPHAAARRNENVSVAQIATFLDPRFKTMICETKKHRESIISYVRILYQNAKSDEIVDPLTTEAQNANEFDQFMSAALDQEEPEDEFEMYVKEKTADYKASRNPLFWWKNYEVKYPTISKLAKRYLCIPATSAPSERVFSTAGNIITAKRNCLAPENVEMLIFIFQNSEERRRTQAKREQKEGTKVRK
ncbi:hypothetical protein B566_EDAN017646 [Ephemera danica]|nr:hypothetical protein B566_EDAN017646 [Ephemera danica]